MNIRKRRIAAKKYPIRNSVHCSVIRFFCGQKNLAQMSFSLKMLPSYGDKCVTRPTIHAWCKKFAHGHESVGRRVVSTTDATITAVDFLMRSNRRMMR